MLLREIMSTLERVYPTTLAEAWDNVGLLVGDADREVSHVLTALDLSDEAVDKAIAIGADLIVTHHPLIFKPVARITKQDMIGRRILRLAENGISYYAMHTNFDIAGMADLNAAQLGLENTAVLQVTACDEAGKEVGLGRIGELPRKISVVELAEIVKAMMNLPSVRVYGDAHREVSRVAVCSGSGRSLIDDALAGDAQVYVTGDLDYHSAIDAVSRGLILIDAGHYGTENIFVPFMRQKMKNLFPQLTVEAMDDRRPYAVI